MFLTILKNHLGLKSLPRFCTYLITWRCNARCQICQVWQKQNQEELTLKEIENIFSQLKLDAIAIKGGEPFLREDLAEVINLIEEKSRPKLIHLTSNGLLTQPIISFFQRIKKPSKIHLKISLDGSPKKHNQIRGIPQAFEKTFSTLEKIAPLRKKYGFYLGVNQTITNPNDLTEYQYLKKLLQPLKIRVHPMLAYEKSALYASKPGLNLTACLDKIYPQEKFPPEEMKEVFSFLRKEANQIPEFKEKLTVKYYLQGLFNRVVLKKQKPNPPCLALKTHLRILPNGDVPVCLFNAQIVGNLKTTPLKELWLGSKIEPFRKMIKKCPGCWAGCEVIPNAIYTGDISRSLFY